MLHALDSVYQAAKAYDKAIPSWPKLAKLHEQKAEVQSGSLRIIRKDGIAPNSTLEAKGFVVDVQIKNEQGVYEITSMMDNLKMITAKKIKDDDAEDAPELVDIVRTDLLSTYSIHEMKKVVHVAGYPSPSNHIFF